MVSDACLKEKDKNTRLDYYYRNVTFPATYLFFHRCCYTTGMAVLARIYIKYNIPFTAIILFLF